MTYKEITNRVAKDMNIPVDVVDSAYKSYWKFIRNTIEELPLKEELDNEKFSKLRTSFNMPSLGKLSCTYDRMINVKRHFKQQANINI